VRTLSLREQAAWMRQIHSTFLCTATGRVLRCTGCLQPTPGSRFYKVVITCESGGQPAVHVTGLQAGPNAERIPHTYAPDRPCLFHTASRDWRSDMKIANTIVPWLSLWLFHYEVWHATGEWLGGGIEHGDDAK
jgi:hypothetical protein